MHLILSESHTKLQHYQENYIIRTPTTQLTPPQPKTPSPHATVPTEMDSSLSYHSPRSSNPEKSSSASLQLLKTYPHRSIIADDSETNHQSSSGAGTHLQHHLSMVSLHAPRDGRTSSPNQLQVNSNDTPQDGMP